MNSFYKNKESQEHITRGYSGWFCPSVFSPISRIHIFTHAVKPYFKPTNPKPRSCGLQAPPTQSSEVLGGKGVAWNQSSQRAGPCGACPRGTWRRAWHLSPNYHSESTHASSGLKRPCLVRGRGLHQLLWAGSPCRPAGWERGGCPGSFLSR